jgi:hypothetical protein
MDVIYLAHVHSYLLKFMGNVLNTLIEFFQEDKWNFTKHPEYPILIMGVNGKNGTWECTATAQEEEEYFIFYSRCPVTVPHNQYQTMAKFLMSINGQVLLGNFEMDLNDGSIRYKTSIKFKGDRLSKALIKQLVYRNIYTMDTYLPSIQAVSQGRSPFSRQTIKS